MKRLLERLFKTMLNKNDQSAKELPATPKGNGLEGLSRKKFTLGALGISAVLLCVCVYLILDSLSLGTGAAVDSFGPAKDKAAEDAYQFFYDKSFEAAEEAHHVSNNVSIIMGDLREVQKLEVLKVSNVSYAVTKPEDQGWLDKLFKDIAGLFNADVVSWLEVPGKGVFTVDLQIGEFVIDEERQYVLIRVPHPELTEFAIDYKNVEVLYFEKGGAFKNSAKYGVDKARTALQDAELKMMQEITNDQAFYQKAMESTKKILINLVQQLNPQLPDLVVEVEFID